MTAASSTPRPTGSQRQRRRQPHLRPSTPDGRPVCWGHDAYGESTPPRRPSCRSRRVTSPPAACATDSTIFCWGYETWRRPSPSSPVPSGHWAVASGAQPQLRRVQRQPALLLGRRRRRPGHASHGRLRRQVSLGEQVSCALGVDGTTGCWGPAIEGAPPPCRCARSPSAMVIACGHRGRWQPRLLGANAWMPVVHSPPAGAFRAVAVGGPTAALSRVMARSPAGAPTTPARRHRPRARSSRSRPRAATACAIAADGSLACWGANDAGQATPPRGTFVSVGVGATTACALADSGMPACWGAPLADTAAAPGDTRLTQVSMGLDHACGVVSSGILDCWGADQVGQAQPPIPGAPVRARPITPRRSPRTRHSSSRCQPTPSATIRP